MPSTPGRHALTRRRFAQGMAALGAGTSTRARAQPLLPSLRIVCADAPGQPADIVSRRLADRLGGGRLAWDVLVVNIPADAARQAVDLARHAPADGSVVLVAPSSVVTVLPHQRIPPARTALDELAPVSALASFQFALIAGPALPAWVASVTGLARWCQLLQAPARCGVAASASTERMLAGLLSSKLGVILNCVSLSDGSAIAAAAASGSVEIAICPEAAARTLVQRGEVRVLATTGVRRSALYPTAATFAEQGLPSLSHAGRLIAFVTASVPPARRAAMEAAILTTLRDVEMTSTLQRLALDHVGMALARLEAALVQEFKRWGALALK